MAVLEQRRVKSLRLTTSSRDLARRGVILLEDALRTASMPHLPASGMIVVRSLNLGKIAGGSSPASISLAIEQQLRNVGFAAVPADSHSAVNASAVYFRDGLNPLIGLASRIAVGGDTSAWFWQAAVPSWKRDMPRHEAMRAILFASTQIGALGPVSLVSKLHEQGTLSPMLASLTPQDGHELLRVTGVSRPTLRVKMAGKMRRGDPQPRDDWRPVLNQWANRWGVDDARSLWLTVCVIASDKPVRLMNPALMQSAQRAIYECSDLSDDSGKAAMPSKANDPRSPVNPASRDANDHKAGQASPTHEDETSPRLREAASSPPESNDAHEMAYLEKSTNMRELEKEFASPEAALEPDDTSPALVDSGDTSRLSLDTSDVSDDLVIEKSARPQEGRTEDRPRDDTPDGYSFDSSHVDGGGATENGGLLFLLSALSRLGIVSQIEAFPELIEIDFPNRLLRHLAASLDIYSDDPIINAIGPLEEYTNADLDWFVVPNVWKDGICEAGFWNVSKIEYHRGKRVVLDASGQLPVAAWQGHMPEEARSFPTDYRMIRSAPLPYKPFIEVLLDAWLTALRRWCDVYANLDLLEIARRPARVESTRTHIDVVFDFEQVDTRIRRAGLDINPGWLPWLGKVVQFHYVSEG